MMFSIANSFMNWNYLQKVICEMTFIYKFFDNSFSDINKIQQIVSSYKKVKPCPRLNITSYIKYNNIIISNQILVIDFGLFHSYISRLSRKKEKKNYSIPQKTCRVEL